MPKQRLFSIGSALVMVALLSVNFTQAQADDLLVKVKRGTAKNFSAKFMAMNAQKVEVLTDTWVHVQGPSLKVMQQMQKQFSNAGIEYVQPNYKLGLLNNYKSNDPMIRAMAYKHLVEQGKNPLDPGSSAATDNPAIPAIPAQTVGADPQFSNQWGMNDVGVKNAWQITQGNPAIVVAVIDTGVDYTHEDLLPNMWRNPGETGMDASGKDKATNNVDDDNNGYVDDVVGYDFAANDSKPYDLSIDDPFQLIFGGGNPGHGTHCAGNVAAKGNNGKGIAGVAPNVRIMAVRFLSEKGQGTTAGAIKSVKYAVDNGAKVLSNSWGSEGEDPSEASENQALRDVIKYAQEKNILFIAAAGNGHQGVGYNNDTDSKPAYPASYTNENIVSVAALDVSNNLGSFSNWGAQGVDIGAPGVKVYSTVPKNKYQDTVIDLPQFGIVATWDGTSMATPHVAGAAALYLSQNPTKTFAEVKAALLNSAVKISALSGKSVSGGKLNVDALMKQP